MIAWRHLLTKVETNLSHFGTWLKVGVSSRPNLKLLTCLFSLRQKFKDERTSKLRQRA